MPEESSPGSSSSSSTCRDERISSSWTKSRVFLVMYIIIFIMCTKSKYIQSMILYVHVVNFPFWLDDPAYHGLPDARNIAITLPDGSVVNGWHLLPAGDTATRSAFITDSALREEYFDTSLREADSVVLSFHGNAGNRGTRDRVAEDRMLASQVSSGNCHVLAIDYRGFGESSGWLLPVHWPTEESTAEDTKALWSWLERKLLVAVESAQDVSEVKENETSSCKNFPSIFIYGHSLGCAISTQLASHLSSLSSPQPKEECTSTCDPSQSRSLQLSGLILVSPFTSVPEVARDYPYTAFLRLVPYATDVIANNLHFTYSNLEAIVSVACPILVIHGVGDSVIPVEHGKRLTDTFVNSFSAPCEGTELSIAAGDAYSGAHFVCKPILSGDTVVGELGDKQLPSRHISFVEVQNAGHNWVFTQREWLATVPDFINRNSKNRIGLS